MLDAGTGGSVILTGSPTGLNGEGRDFKHFLNPTSLEVLTAKLEPGMAQPDPSARYQLERLAYFCSDPRDSKPGKPVLNRTITLKDAWAKEQGKA